MGTMTSECFMLAANGWVPNNSQLPVIVYRAMERGDCDEIARAFERRFGRHGWPPD